MIILRQNSDKHELTNKHEVNALEMLTCSLNGQLPNCPFIIF